MDDTSIFDDKAAIPDDTDLSEKLGPAFALWVQLREYVMSRYPKGIAEWNYPGRKYGWSFRIKDRKRAIIYFLPREEYFKVAFVFGQRAYEAVLAEKISPGIKQELEQARVYAEGRGIRIDVADHLIISDIMKLVDIKLEH